MNGKTFRWQNTRKYNNAGLVRQDVNVVHTLARAMHSTISGRADCSSESRTRVKGDAPGRKDRSF